MISVSLYSWRLANRIFPWLERFESANVMLGFQWDCRRDALNDNEPRDDLICRLMRRQHATVGTEFA